MVTYINQNNSIDTFYELFIVLAIFLFAMVFLCKIGNFLQALPIREPKKKTSVKEVKVEKVKEVKKEEKVEKDATKVVAQDSASSVSATATASAGGYPYVNNTTPIIIHQYPNPNDPYQSGGYGFQNNYLYDRFVDRPTSEDYIQPTKISQAFMSDNEFNAVKNSDVKIRVNDNSMEVDKNKLYLYRYLVKALLGRIVLQVLLI